MGRINTSQTKDQVFIMRHRVGDLYSLLPFTLNAETIKQVME